MSVASLKTQPRVTSSDSLFSFVLGAWSLWNLFPVLGAWSAKSARISFSRSFVKCVVNLSGWNILSQSHYIGSFKMHEVIQPANTSRCMFSIRLNQKPYHNTSDRTRRPRENWSRTISRIRSSRTLPLHRSAEQAIQQPCTRWALGINACITSSDVLPRGTIFIMSVKRQTIRGFLDKRACT